jgi:hypothetical protein
LFHVSQLANDKKYKEAIDLLDGYAVNRPTNELATKFAIVQILLTNVTLISKTFIFKLFYFTIN